MKRTFSDPGVLDRRELLTGAAADRRRSGVRASRAARAAEATPTSGGTLKLGMAGGATSDSLDPRTITDWVPVNLAYQIMNGFIEIDENNQPVPELLERWESKPGAADWVFDVRKGVTFSNGKTLDADDIIYSLNLHRGDTKSAAKATLGDIAEVKKLGPEPDRHHDVERQRGPALPPVRLPLLRRPGRLDGLDEAGRHGRLHARGLRARHPLHHEEAGRLLEAGARPCRRDRDRLHQRHHGPDQCAGLGPGRRHQPARCAHGRPREAQGGSPGDPQPRRAARHLPDERPRQALRRQQRAAGAEIWHRPPEDHRYGAARLRRARQRPSDPDERAPITRPACRSTATTPTRPSSISNRRDSTLYL